MVDYARGKGGHFAKGNKGGPGYPYSKQVGALRQALMDAVTPEDIQEIIVLVLVEAAKDGDLAAAREVILRTIGKPLESDLLERLERLEQAQAGGAATTA